jgi:hypothetical protein
MYATACLAGQLRYGEYALKEDPIESARVLKYSLPATVALILGVKRRIYEYP